MKRDADYIVLNFANMANRATVAREQRELARKRLEIAQATGGNVLHRDRCYRRATRKLRYLKAAALVERRFRQTERAQPRPRQRSTRRGHSARSASSSSDDPGEPEPAEGRQYIENFAGTDPSAEGLERAGTVRGQQAVSGAARSQGPA